MIGLCDCILGVLQVANRTVSVCQSSYIFRKTSRCPRNGSGGSVVLIDGRLMVLDLLDVILVDLGGSVL